MWRRMSKAGSYCQVGYPIFRKGNITFSRERGIKSSLDSMVATKRSKGMTPSKTHTPPMCRGISLHSKLRNAASSAPKRAGSWGSAMTASLRETRILRLYCLVIHGGMQGVQGAAGTRGKGKVNRLAEIVAAHEKHGRNINRGAVPLDRGRRPRRPVAALGKVCGITHECVRHVSAVAA